MTRAFRSETILTHVGRCSSTHSPPRDPGTPAAPSETAALERRDSWKPVEGSAHLNV